MIWTSRRYSLSARPPMRATSRPLKKIDPAVGFSSATISLDTVDFPQPDSPTRPSVSPRRRVRSTPSTARTWPTVRLKTIPWVSGKCFFRPRISSSASPGVDALRDAAVAPVVGSDTQDLLAVVAGRLAAGDDQAQRREVGGALAAGCRRGPQPAARAPRVERAAAGDRRQVRRLPDDRLQPAALGLHLRD